MSVVAAGKSHIVLFDGDSVYDKRFPDEKIQGITSSCGARINQEQLVEICKKKMENMNVVQSAFDGRWLAEDKNTPFTCSAASETYWST